MSNKWILRTKQHLSLKSRARLIGLLDRFLDRWHVRSYSQFGEDVFIFRYFRAKNWDPTNGHSAQRGFYVDIGAYSPVDCSSTMLFYQHGWSGINVDATPGVMKAFEAARPRDVNLEVAVANQSGELPLFVFGTPSVLNTTSAVMAREMAERLGAEPQVVRVSVQRLRDILDRQLQGDWRIDFLTIDVEGAELDVLESNDWEKYRPEIVAVEKHGPCIADHLKSPLMMFMAETGYELIAWLQPTLVFKDCQGVKAGEPSLDAL